MLYGAYQPPLILLAYHHLFIYSNIYRRVDGTLWYESTTGHEAMADQNEIKTNLTNELANVLKNAVSEYPSGSALSK